MQAAASATRGCGDDVRKRTDTRRAFVQLADRVGWRDTSVLAAACNTTTQAVRDHLRQAPTYLASAALCLSDERLRITETHVTPRRARLKAG